MYRITLNICTLLASPAVLFNMFDSATPKNGDGKITKKGFRKVALELLSGLRRATAQASDTSPHACALGSDKVAPKGTDGTCALDEKKLKSLGELMAEMVFAQVCTYA